MAKAVRSVEKPYSAADFLLEDFPRTLFPLTTNKVLCRKNRGRDDLLTHENIIAGSGKFLPQRRVYANKDPLHLRRTIKLDPVAEFYFYHIIHKIATSFVNRTD